MCSQANYTSDRGVRVIRPLMCAAARMMHYRKPPLDSTRSYVREMMTRAYADAALLPVIEDNCPACFKVVACCTLFPCFVTFQQISCFAVSQCELGA